MIVLEFKLKGKAEQYRSIDDMIRTAQFVRNKTLRHWIDNQGIKLVDLYKQCAIMAKEFEWSGKLNSTARQVSASRKKAINKLGRKHLKVSRQRKDFAIKTAPKRGKI